MSEHIFDQKWNTASLLRFAFPTIVMMVFMGLYTIVDTIFVARFVSTDALSAINIVCPVINLTVGLGTMIAAGGSAVVSRKMGAGLEQEAKEDFTLLVLAAAGIGAAILICGTLWLNPILLALGASERLLPFCRDYLGLLLLFLPANVIQTVYANLFVTAGKPGLGFGLSVLAGLANILLDYIFIVPGGMEIRGAALGTGLGYLIPAAAGTVFFFRNRGALSFVKPRWRGALLTESCLNGSSEMVGQLAAALTTFLFNLTMMERLGEDGVAAVTIMIYSQFLLNTLFIGFSMGVAPVIGFHYGSGNRKQQRKILSICIRFLAAASLLIFALSISGGPLVVRMFTPDASRVYEIAAAGFPVFSVSFLFCGFNIFISALFTALSNGKVSAVLSFLRTFGLLCGGILLLPRLFGITGVWMAVPMAEGIMFFVSLGCLIYYRE
ncbi:MAG: MATE family efflux transporter [Lachnospiraceae bacterium]|jgi:putative MATE family efflux protein|nr:MATE family efflux transporter [Lachnospiraceae bacterium]